MNGRANPGGVAINLADLVLVEQVAGWAVNPSGAAGGAVGVEDRTCCRPLSSGPVKVTGKAMSPAGAAATGHDEFVEGVGSEGGRGAAAGVGVDGHDERGGAGHGWECVQVTCVDTSVGAVGGAVEVVRHGGVSLVQGHPAPRIGEAGTGERGPSRTKTGRTPAVSCGSRPAGASGGVALLRPTEC